MSDTAIRVEHLSKQYRIGLLHQPNDTLRDQLVTSAKRLLQPKRQEAGDSGIIWALRDISFEVKQGEVLGIIGHNGAGKSTLLKILSRITKPTEGRAVVSGRVGSLLEVGTGFHSELTGRENIYLNGAILGMSHAEIRSRFDEIVAFAEVEKFIDTPVKRYSSGMYMRLAFAVAAHLEPEILVIDEVLAVGDVAFQKKCLGKMENVAREGRTILFVSHNLAAVRKLCSHALLLEQGHVMLHGRTEEVVSRYLASTIATSESIVALPDAKPGAPGRAIWLKFCGEDGAPRTIFRIGERWRIGLEIELFTEIKHIIAAVGIVTTEGIPLTTFYSEVQDQGCGHYEVEFECDYPFASCELRFVIGLSSYENSFYYLQDIGHVSISNVSIDDQPIRSSGTGILISSHRPTLKDMTSAAIAEARRL